MMIANLSVVPILMLCIGLAGYAVIALTAPAKKASNFDKDAPDAKHQAPE